MRFSHSNSIRWLAMIVVVIGLAALVLFNLRKTITLSINGESQTFTTSAQTVGGLLRAQDFALTSGDLVTPPVDHWLKDGDTITLERAVPVLIAADGTLHTLFSASRLPADWLAQAGLSLKPGDQLLAGDQIISPDQPRPRLAAHTLQIHRVVTFSLQQGLQTQVITSTAATLGRALWVAGIPLYAADLLSPPAETPLTAGLQAVLQPAQVITITIQGHELPFRTTAATVGEALAAAGLALQGLDYSLPAASAPIPVDGRLRLVRVQESVILEQTPLPYETLTQVDDTVELDTREVVQPGEPGLAARRVRVRFEDGQEVSRQAENEWVARPPKPEIIGLGMKVVMHTLDTPDGPITYWRALTFYATSYHPSGAGGSGTATGATLRKGIVAIDPRYIPYGTQLYIPGYGVGEAADTGGFYGRWIDLGYSDGDYVAWHQWVTVYFLGPPPAFIPVTIPYPVTASGYSP